MPGMKIPPIKGSMPKKAGVRMKPVKKAMPKKMAYKCGGMVKK